MRVYIVWVKNKKDTFKNPLGRMFLDYLTRRSYPWDIRENDSLARLFSFQSCAPHMALLRVSYSRNPLILYLSLILHKLNTKPNTIKSHKIQGNKLKQLQHFLSWNKANIKHSCKSQLYKHYNGKPESALHALWKYAGLSQIRSSFLELKLQQSQNFSSILSLITHGQKEGDLLEKVAMLL